MSQADDDFMMWSDDFHNDRDDDDTVTIGDIEVKASTPKAILIEVDGEEHWIPRSQLLDGTDVDDVGDEGKIVIPKWLADDRGLG